jgi:ankyrin repeat protein
MRSRTPLHFAAQNRRKECVELLLRVGADKDAKDMHSRTQLHCAAQNRRKECVELRLRVGADNNKKDMHSRTPLHGEAQNENKECVELLQRPYADPSVRTVPHPSWSWIRGNATPAELAGSHEHVSLLAQAKLRAQLATLIAASARSEP